ncbi:hypothetical protein [Butyrivibrio sp. M55]|uniref:hypothetical protein n=1 Tax=Butyrivibrio sp. M55 TaxID=1855323 RepID=UPI0008F0BAA3|nr:hypothetical protein [Butyrivibrio sp. M55]SFU87024.1 hypothetical protein SAMN05216540_11577 [Butyrivibrio sp. M55]
MDSIKGTFRYNHAICITEELLKELDALYRNYFGEPEYKVNLGLHTITLNKLEDVLAIDNFGDETIIAMTIGSIWENYITFEVSSFHLHKAVSNTVEVEYRIDNLDNANNYRRKLEKTLEKGKRSKFYEFFSHLSISSVWLVIAVIMLYNSIYTKYFSDMDLNQSLSLYEFILLIICILGVALILNYIMIKGKKLFPPIVFCWGEEIKAEKRRSNIRHNVFWSVFVATFLSFIIGIVVNFIT